jgi:hypothetical protein
MCKKLVHGMNISQVDVAHQELADINHQGLVDI